MARNHILIQISSLIRSHTLKLYFETTLAYESGDQRGIINEESEKRRKKSHANIPLKRSEAQDFFPIFFHQKKSH